MADANKAPRGVLLWVAYDGSSFSGFVRQKNAVTVTEHLEAGLKQMARDASTVRYTSRTDAGVHALRHPVAFTSCLDVTPRGWVLGLSRHLPREIGIMGAAQVPPDYDPRRFAVRKTYHYLIYFASVRDPFLESRAWRVGYDLDVGLMQAEASACVGTHDFRAFRASADPRAMTVRTLSEVTVTPVTSGFPAYAPGLLVKVTGDRFLYNMVRIMVGTFVDVGRGRIAPGAAQRALLSGERTDLGVTAPPDGLCLHHVELSDAGVNAWPREASALR